MRAASARSTVVARAMARHGGLWAVGFVILTHMAFTTLIFPYPVARPDLRRKVVALTRESKPRVIFAGDSRAACQIVPAIVAGEMGLPPREVINIGVDAGESTMTAAVFREFRTRFAEEPLLILSVSPHNVMERGVPNRYFNTEYYWAVGFADRWEALSCADAIRTTFTPERVVLRRLHDWIIPPKPDIVFGAGGFRALPDTPIESARDGYPRTVDRLRRWGCFRVGDERAATWRQFRKDLRAMRALGARVFVLDTPDHPAFLARLDGLPEGVNYRRYRATLARVCRDIGVPLLRYDVRDLGGVNPDDVFWDALHLTPRGAERLSHRVGMDLRTMMKSAGRTSLRPVRFSQR